MKINCRKINTRSFIKIEYINKKIPPKIKIISCCLSFFIQIAKDIANKPIIPKIIMWAIQDLNL